MSGWTSFTGSGIGNTETNIWSVTGTYQVKVQAKDIPGATSSWSDPLTVIISSGENEPPNKPSTPSGKTNGKAGVTYQYSSTTTDPDGDLISYLFDWGDGSDSGWTTAVPSGITMIESHSWNEQGDYQVKVKARDINFAESEWSEPLSISMPKNKQIGNIIVVGIMDSIATTVENRDYEVKIIAIVIESGSTHIFNSGEMIRIYNFQSIEFGSIVVAFCDDWGIIG